YGCGEGGRQLDTFPLHAREAGEAERDRVSARAQINDLVETFGVCRDRSNFLDEHRTRGLDRYARQDTTRGVLDKAGNAALSERGRRYTEHQRQHWQHQSSATSRGHAFSPKQAVTDSRPRRNAPTRPSEFERKSNTTWSAPEGDFR